MRLVWGIALAFCLGSPAWGVVCEQENSGAASATGQNPAESAPQNEPRAEQKKETPTTPQLTKTEPETEIQQTKPEVQPQIQPTIDLQPTGAKTEPATKADAASPAATVKRHSAGKHTRAITPHDGPRKVVVREGGAEEPTAQIVTGMAPEEASRKRQDAEQLLKATDATVKRVAPGPADAQLQETVSQIHNYMQGARAALKEGDISRAHTLAVKAGLLADDLERH